MDAPFAKRTLDHYLHMGNPDVVSIQGVYQVAIQVAAILRDLHEDDLCLGRISSESVIVTLNQVMDRLMDTIFARRSLIFDTSADIVGYILLCTNCVLSAST